MNQFKSKLIPPSETDSYPLAKDGGLIYDPISREKLSRGTNILDYGKTDTVTEVMESCGVRLSFTVPKKIVSYDAVPIRYTLEMNGEKKPVYVEAASDEDCGRSAPREYDLVLPGNVDIEYEYLGYVAGYACPETRPVLRSDFNDTVSSKFPNYDVSPLTLSSEVEKCDITWFKFRYKNIGNTVLSGDGNGTFCFSPELYKKENGEYILYAIPENIFYRVIDRVYPGEGGELYVTFCNYPGYKLPSISLEEGEYKIVMRGIVRNENTNPERFERIIWSGDVYSSSEMEFTVKKGAEIKEAVMRKAPHAAPKRDRWLHTYEEFRTSYDAYLSEDPREKGNAEATLYLQCAPWDNSVTVKLIIGDGDTLVSKRIPIENDSESVKVRFNPDNKNYVIRPDGTRFPAITAQSMVDMRCNVHQGPDPAGNIIGTLLDMKKTGINLINSTAAFEFDATGGKGVNNNIDAFWLSVDVMRRLSLSLEGYITYPYMSRGNITKAEWINKNEMDKFRETGASEDEALSYANAVKSTYQFNRWGDVYWLGGDGSVVLSLEDTRGWMRIDYNAREPMSADQKKAFIEYVRGLYGDTDELNKAWGSHYAAFEEIDPEAGAAVDHGYFSFKDKSHVFGEWGRALSDLDEFRTLYRVKNYREMVGACAGMMPEMRIDMRTEGANYTSVVDPETKNTHFRHVYYSQRRNAMIPELLYGTDTLYAHSDYVTLPYTPSEVRYLTKSSVENGIIPMHMPQFNRMRDIAVNEKWGNDFSFEYNTCGNTSKGAYINTVCSVFEWFRETYENGGLPGILWQDYLCDGYATETQRREIRFFADKLAAALDCDEGRRWMNDTDGRTKEVRARSHAKHSYDDGLVEKLIEKSSVRRKTSDDTQRESKMKNSLYIDSRVSKKALNRFFSELEDISCDLYAMKIYNDSSLMLSLASHPYSTDDKREVYSLSKSFTSTAVGILVTEGKLSLDDRLVDLFPDKVPSDMSDKMSRVRVRHILSMNTGHASCTAPRVFYSDDAVREFMSIDPEYEPGTHFTYNTGASCILSCIVERVSGMRLLDFLTLKLFVPLGIKGIHWNHVRSGQNEGGCGIYISADDIAKLGLLYLGGGVYGGKRYLSEEYVKEATSAVSDNSSGGSKDWRAGYGFQFWRCADGGFRGDGAFGQYCYVVPEKNIVAAVQASVGDMQAELNALAKLVSSLTDECGEEELLLPQYKPFSSDERIPKFARKYYSLDSNPMGWNGVYFDYDPSRDELDAVFTDGYDHALLKAGCGHYAFCDFTAVRFQPKIHFTPDTDHSHLASSYRITDGCVEIEVRFLNCPHKLIIAAKTDSDGEHIDISLTCGNINMGPSSHLTGTLAE